MNIIIDPRCRINYAAYYIKGFRETVAKDRISFSIKPFIKNSLFEERNDYINYMLIFVTKEGVNKKIIIDFGDYDAVSHKHYEWCDIYAKINVARKDINTMKKLIPIGPSFGINLIDSITLKLLFKSLKIKDKPVSNLEYFKNFIYMKVRRRRYEDYLGSVSHDNYIFAISTLWYDSLTFKTTNFYRIAFFNICKKVFKKVEGGFFYIEDDVAVNEFPQYEIYKEKIKIYIYTKRISPSDYIMKTKKSTIVFNTPSVKGCHGWKLGEYFAMGKAIISMPLENLMPNELEQNKDVAFVSTDADIEDKIKEIFSNDNFRHELERSASKYFERYLSPIAVINRIILAAFPKLDE